MESSIKHCIPVDNETESSAVRSTKDGKQITYRLNVLQQPHRARACGAGLKSSADRRPVDPPPIVELKIFLGEGTGEDITYTIGANYFLFATLEQARPMAQGRVSEDKNRLTVLTGTPVAGVVHLDRPSPAGYFIFPDLSVRHEGVYRLSFSLYEELTQVNGADSAARDFRDSTPGDAHVTHRLEVKSVPFTVFSAKKFPGLTESTSLSRMVAEQGCRVRIRRDVRMRRRDTKGGAKDWDGYEDDTAQARARASMTPDPALTLPAPNGFMDPMARPRSASNGSHLSLANPLSRRTSQEMDQNNHHAVGAAPHTPHSAYGQSMSYGPSSSQQYPQPPFMQQQPAMHQPPHQHHGQVYPPPPPMPAPGPSQQGHYPYSSALPLAPALQAQYAPRLSPIESGPQHQRMSMDYHGQPPVDPRRSSTHYPAPASLPQAGFPSQPMAPSHQSYPPQHQSYQPLPPPQPPVYQNPRQHFSSQDAYPNRIPPAQPVQPSVRASGATTPLSARPTFDRPAAASLPPLRTSHETLSKLEASSPLTATPQNSYYSSTTTPIDGHKRNYSSVFNDRHLYQPLRHGARPDSTPHQQAQSSSSNTVYSTGIVDFPSPDDDEDEEDVTGDLNPDNKKLQYLRAEGHRVTRGIGHL